MEKRGSGGRLRSAVLLAALLGACGKADRSPQAAPGVAAAGMSAGGVGDSSSGAAATAGVAGQAGSNAAGQGGLGAGGSGSGSGLAGGAGSTSAGSAASSAAGSGGASAAGQGGEGGEPSAPLAIALDPTWAHWPMPNPASSGLPHAASYDTSRPGLVVDEVTGLIWQREIAATKLTWTAAQAYCDALELGGYDDWRLPSRIELISLIDLSRDVPAIDVDAFPNTPSDDFYSASVDNALVPNNVLFVNFTQGYSDWVGQKYSFNVRCVHAEPYLSPNGVPPDRYRVGSQTIVDLGTQLMWERSLATESQAWISRDATLARCSALVLGGHDDWRVPNLKELLSLIDEHQKHPAIDHQVFLNVKTEPWRYWTSSYLLGKPGPAPYFTVRLTDGVTELDPDGNEETICTRDADLVAEPLPP